MIPSPIPAFVNVPSAAPVRPSRRWDPWPIGITAFLVVFAGCVAGFIAFAVRQQNDLVRPDYYEEEIRYQTQMNRIERTHSLGTSAAVTADVAGRELTVRIPVSHLATLSLGTVQLYRPSDAGRDRVVKLTPSAEGRQVVSLTDLEPGLWRARVRWTSGGLEYSMDDALVLPPGASPEPSRMR